MDSYLKMASKINMGSMSHTSLISYVKIWESTNSADPIEVPLEKDGSLLLSTLIGQYPNTAGLRFWSDTGAWRGLKVENNVIYPPPQGWGTLDYYIVFGPANLKRESEEEVGPASKSQRTEVEQMEEAEAEFQQLEEPEELEEEVEEEEMAADPVEIKEEEETTVPEIIIQALPFVMKDKELSDHLSQFGELESCQIIKDRQGNSRGYAFLRFKTLEGTEKARAGIHIFNGRRYYLQIANKDRRKNNPPNFERVKLFVGHLPAGADEGDLRRYFSKYGVLKDVYIPKPNKGYGFIEFGSQKVADKVLGDTHILMDTFLNVNYPTTPKQNDVRREMEKMQKDTGNGKPGILGYYGVGPMGMPNDMSRNMQGNYNNYNNNNYNNNYNNYSNRNNNNNNRNNYRDPYDNRNNMNGRGGFRGRGRGGVLPRAPWATN